MSWMQLDWAWAPFFFCFFYFLFFFCTDDGERKDGK
jgi:hypothetical protein